MKIHFLCDEPNDNARCSVLVQLLADIAVVPFANIAIYVRHTYENTFTHYDDAYPQF